MNDEFTHWKNESSDDHTLCGRLSPVLTWTLSCWGGKTFHAFQNDNLCKECMEIVQRDRKVSIIIEKGSSNG